MGASDLPRRWLQRAAGAADNAVSGAVLLREAARTSRRWQTYVSRAAFSGVLMGVLLTGMWMAVSTADSGLMDAANLGWLGRALFIGFSVAQLALAVVLAPLMTASAIVEETDDRTIDLLVLTRLRPGQILGAKVASRLLVLVTVVCGALPLMALVVNLGGVSTTEVIAVTVHTLTTVALMGALGAFFALFTHSPMLATMASAVYSLPFFVMVPMAYVLCTSDPYDAAHFSPLAGSTARDWSALLTPLSYLPAVVVIFGVATPLFQLKVSNADFRHAFGEPVWRMKLWAQTLGVWFAVAVLTAPGAIGVAWMVQQKSGGLLGGPADAVLQLASVGWIWILFAVGVALGTWAYLRVGMDVVDGIDSVFTRPATDPERTRAVEVGSNPVWWREARPRAWGSAAAPIFVTWLLVLLAVFQTGWWVFPGGLLAVGVLNSAATLLLTAWMGTRSVVEERRRGTLEVLLTTTLPSWRILAGKAAGVALPTFPMLLLSLPLLALGVPHLHAIDLFGGGGSDTAMWEWAVRGVLAWLWLVPWWILAMVGSLGLGMRVSRPRSAFGLVIIGLLAVLGPPTVAGRLFPDLALLTLPSRVLAPPLAGGAAWWQLLLGVALASGVALTLSWLLATRLRPWAGQVLAVLLTLALPLSSAWAQPSPEEIRALEIATGIRLRAEPIVDGIVRPGRWTALAVTVENSGSATVGRLVLEERAADAMELRTWTREVELPEGSRKEVLLLFQPGSHSRDRTLTLTTRDARKAMWVFQVTPLPEDAVTIAVIGRDPAGVTAVSDAWSGPVPGRVPRDLRGEDRKVRVGLVPTSDLPRQSVAWGAPDWIVWPSADASTLSEAQARALRAWVADGGHLLLTVTDTWRQAESSALEPLLPLDLVGQRDAELGPLVTALGGFQTGSAPIAMGVPVAGRPVMVRSATDSGDPLWVSAPYGLGTVHLLTADLGVAPLDALDRETTWRRLLHLTRPGAARAVATGLSSTHRDQLEQAMDLVPPPAWQPPAPWEDDTERSWLKSVRDRLSDIPGVAPLPFSWLVAFSSLYLLVIGPLDYFVLRALHRQPWTWVTFPVSIAVFSAVALIGTSYTKGSQAVLTRVEVVDVLDDAGLWRGDTWLGIFSTRKTELSIASGFDDAVVAPLDESGFMTDAGIQSGSGGARLTYGAETWTLAYARTSWTTESQGQIRVEPAGGGALRFINELPHDLEVAGVWVGGEGSGVSGWVDLGELPRGAEVTLPADPIVDPLPVTFDDDTSFAVGLLHPSLDLGRGAAGIEQRPLTFVGVAHVSIEPLSLSGLSPIDRPLLVMRQAVLTDSAVRPELTTLPILVELAAGLAVDEVQLLCDGGQLERTQAVTGPRVRFDGIPRGLVDCQVGLWSGSRGDWQSISPGATLRCEQTSDLTLDCTAEPL